MPLKISLAAVDPLEINADVVAVGVYAGASVKEGVLASLDRALGGGLAKLVLSEDFKGKKDQWLELPTLGRLAAARLFVVGLGTPEALGDVELRTFAAKAARAANGAKARSLALSVPEGIGGERMRYLAEGLVLGAYRFTKYLTGERKPKAELVKATLAVPPGNKIGKTEKSAVELGEQIADAVCITRDLVNEPANELVPADLARVAQQVAKKFGLKCQVFDRREIERRGMKLLIAVGQGSANEPRFVHMQYTPGKKAKKRVVLVGKGLTFDSGGLCIKPAPGMGEMKVDMSGAGNVVGLMAAVAALAPNVEVHGIIASAENMPDGASYRPGDVFGSLDGKTVEIINTDAEGRLVLADALAYARKLEPDVLIDNATLTGACVVALGQTCSAFYSTTDELGDKFAAAAKEAGEQFWRMPLLEDLKDQLKSDVADMKHMGDRWGGSITAALFLREFVGNCAWIHADIAGPVLANSASGFYPKGATGHGVLTFLRFIEQMG